MQFALLNYTYGTNGIAVSKENPYMVHLLDDEEKIRSDIKNAKSDADFVIVFAHWGIISVRSRRSRALKAK